MHGLILVQFQIAWITQCQTWEHSDQHWSLSVRIEDADFAKVTGDLTKSQIMSQAATAMLAQANASKQGVLSLLQG